MPVMVVQKYEKKFVILHTVKSLGSSPLFRVGRGDSPQPCKTHPYDTNHSYGI